MKGPLAYIGGKNRVASQIISLIPEHQAYVEPFAGGAQVFFRKTPSRVEVLNDLNDDVVNFFRVCQQHAEELTRYLTNMVASRAWFELLQKTSTLVLTDIQRAARFIYLQKTSFLGLVVNQQFQYSPSAPPHFNPKSIPKLITDTRDRLARTLIEHLPYEQILSRYDRPETFFYLDPPYYKISLYKHNLKPEDFIKLRDRLQAIKGKFLMSINDRPETRSLFSSFCIRELSLVYSGQVGIAKRRKKNVELLISNYELPEGRSNA